MLVFYSQSANMCVAQLTQGHAPVEMPELPRWLSAELARRSHANTAT